MTSAVAIAAIWNTAVELNRTSPDHLAATLTNGDLALLKASVCLLRELEFDVRAIRTAESHI